jgi:membrane protease YdiL (CAAX protease family)
MNLPPDSNQLAPIGTPLETIVDTSNIEEQSKKMRLIAYAKREISDLRKFIAKPVRHFPTKSTSNEKWTRVAFLFGLVILINAVFELTIGLALETWASLEYTLDVTSIGLILGAIAGAPLFEELMFRAGLRNITYSLFFGPVFICIAVGPWQIALAVCLIAICIAMLMEYSVSPKNKWVNGGSRFIYGRQFIRHYPQVFWLYACAFSLMHVSNYNFSDGTGWFVIFAVIPQFVGGILLGYVRIRDGLTSAMALHFLVNLFAVLMVAIFGA